MPKVTIKSCTYLLYFITGTGEKCKIYVKIFLFLHLVSMNVETLQCVYVSETGCLCRSLWTLFSLPEEPNSPIIYRQCVRDDCHIEILCFVCSSQEGEKGSHKSGGGPPIPVLSSAPGHTTSTAGWEGAEPNTSSLNWCSTLCAHWIYGNVAWIAQEDCRALYCHASIVLYSGSVLHYSTSLSVAILSYTSIFDQFFEINKCFCIQLWK